MIFFYYGEDSFRAQEKIKAISYKFKEKIDPSGHNIQQLDGETMKADDFFQAISVVGFLASKKLVVIKDIFNNKKLKDWQDQLIKFLNKQNDTPEENYLIFWQTDKVDSRSKLYKALKKFKFVEEFNKLKPLALASWIKKRVAVSKKTISPGAVSLLLTYVGNELWQIEQEVSKLVHHSSGEIKEEDVKSLVQAKIDENIFNLVEAIGRKDKALALKLIEEKLNSGVNHQYILSMIVRQFRLLIKAKSLEKQIKYPGALAQALKIPPLVAEKTLTESKLYTPEQLKTVYKKLLLLDEKFKTSRDQEKILFAQMINSL
jgi:DNA polymerase-3 subunit delta